MSMHALCRFDPVTTVKGDSCRRSSSWLGSPLVAPSGFALDFLGPYLANRSIYNPTTALDTIGTNQNGNHPLNSFPRAQATPWIAAISLELIPPKKTSDDGRPTSEHKVQESTTEAQRVDLMASGGLAICRLAEERKSWRKSHPHGFVAKPEKLSDGSVNLLLWNCVIPGKQATDWEGGYFPLTLQFSEYYPNRPPTCKFPAGFFHVNVYDTGAVCLSLLGDAWNPSITVWKILVCIQELLDNPNPDSPAQRIIYRLFAKNMLEYKKRVRQQAKRYSLLVSAQEG